MWGCRDDKECPGGGAHGRRVVGGYLSPIWSVAALSLSSVDILLGPILSVLDLGNDVLD